MANIFTEQFGRQWPILTDTLGETATLTPSVGAPVTFKCLVIGRAEDQSLDASWEEAARQLEVYAASSDAPAVYTPREDTITVRGLTYTVMERQTQQGAVYRYLCERTEVDALQLRGRRY